MGKPARDVWWCGGGVLVACCLIEVGMKTHAWTSCLWLGLAFFFLLAFPQLARPNTTTRKGTTMRNKA